MNQNVISLWCLVERRLWLCKLSSKEAEITSCWPAGSLGTFENWNGLFWFVFNFHLLHEFYHVHCNSKRIFLFNFAAVFHQMPSWFSLSFLFFTELHFCVFWFSLTWNVSFYLDNCIEFMQLIYSYVKWKVKIACWGSKSGCERLGICVFIFVQPGSTCTSFI